MKELSSRVSWWGWLMLLSALTASACLSNIDIPDCVRTHTCSASGGDAGADGNEGATPASGGHATAGGFGGDASGAAPIEIQPMAGMAGGGDGGTGGEGGDGGADDCASCALLPAELVAPCAGKPYRATLNVMGGMAPYEWQLTPAVAGWSLAIDPQHPLRAVLQADAVTAGKTTITVRVTDARGLTKAITYVTTARDACWFAYTASASAGPELRLLDPFAESFPPAELANNVSVYDFRFSPDGRYLVYRYAADDAFPHGRHLALVELATLTEQKLDFAEEAVTAYAWSPDSSVLAVGFRASQKQYLGGVRLPPRNSPNSPSVLSPAPAFVEENLSWIGNSFVAYYAAVLPDKQHPGELLDNPDHNSTAFHSQLGSGGFGDQQFTSDSFEPNLFLQPADDGYWIINTLTMFFPTTGGATDWVVHADVLLVAPSGRYSAGLDGATLQLFAANDGIFNLSAASKPDQPCSMPLAWSRQDKVACVADVANESTGSHGEVRFFELQTGSDLLSMSSLADFCEDDIAVLDPASCTALRQGYGYGISEATRAPRGFSASGRWFAFTRSSRSDSYLYWADLAANPPALTGSLYLQASGAPARLAFSPNERRLALQTGAKLFIKDLSGVSSEMLVSNGLTMLDNCSEEFPTAPDAFCGNTDLDARFKWAPDSKALAFRSPASVSVVDTSHLGEIVAFHQAAPVCDKPRCSGDFEFQPPTQP